MALELYGIPNLRRVQNATDASRYGAAGAQDMARKRPGAAAKDESGPAARSRDGLRGRYVDELV